MSCEHFETVMVADATSPDGQRVEFGRRGEGRPRWTQSPQGWATVYVYAHDALEIAANCVATDPMDGVSGDHPDKRRYIAAVLRSAAVCVRELAADAAGDSALTHRAWRAAVAHLRETSLREGS